MKLKMRKIGNSRGIILPKEVIIRCGLEDEVEIVVFNDQVIIQAPKSKRSSWEAAFKRAAEKDQGMLDNADLIRNDWDGEEWEW